MQIRRLGTEDASIATTVIETMKPHGASDMTQTSVSRFLGSDDRYQGTALDDHDLPVGFLLAYELVRAERASPMMLLYEIEISEPWRRKGVATTMVNLLKGLCADRDVCKMWVETTKSNIAARDLYLSTGADLTNDEGCLSFTYNLE